MPNRLRDAGVSGEVWNEKSEQFKDSRDNRLRTCRQLLCLERISRLGSDGIAIGSDALLLTGRSPTVQRGHRRASVLSGARMTMKAIGVSGEGIDTWKASGITSAPGVV